MEIILESRIVFNPDINKEEYSDGYFLTKKQLGLLVISAHHTKKLQDKKLQEDYQNFAIDWINHYND